MHRVLALILFVLINVISIPVFSESTPDNDPAQQSYPVMLGKHVLFEVPTTLEGLDPKSRAESISRRLTELADNSSVSFDNLASKDYNDPISIILADDELLFAVINEDAEYVGLTRHELAQKLAEKIKTTVNHYRQERHIKKIIKGVVLFVIETFLLIGILFLTRRLYKRIIRQVDEWVDAKKAFLEKQALDLVRIDKMSFLLLALFKTLWYLIVIGLLYIYIQIGLGFFPWTQVIASKLLGFVLKPVTTITMAFWKQVPNLFFLAVIAIITVYILKLMRLFFNGIQDGEIKFKTFYPEWAQPTHGVGRILVIAFAIVVAFPYIPGSNSLAFKGISIFFGVLFSIGSSTAVANILAGYMIIYRRVFTVGDRIKINDIIGDVTETKLQVIHLRTLKNEDLSVPNSLIVNSQVLNYTSLANKHGLILHTTVSIGYDTPWRQVQALLLEAAEKVPEVMKNPAPFVQQKSLDDFYVTYELNVYTIDPKKMGTIYSSLHQQILDVFNENSVQIMSPHYIDDKSEPVIVPKNQWFAHPAKTPEG